MVGKCNAFRFPVSATCTFPAALIAPPLALCTARQISSGPPARSSLQLSTESVPPRLAAPPPPRCASLLVPPGPITSAVRLPPESHSAWPPTPGFSDTPYSHVAVVSLAAGHRPSGTDSTETDPLCSDSSQRLPASSPASR